MEVESVVWWRVASERRRRRGTPAECASAGPFVYRLGRYPFKVERGVRLPYGLSSTDRTARCGWPREQCEVQHEQ